MGERRGTKGLELWCRRMTDGYPGVNVVNMTTSWRDGLAFCAIIHHFRPDLIEFSKLNKDDVYHNNELAFRVAERHLGIPALLEPEDMVEFAVPDRLSILTYLSQFYQAFAVGQGKSPARLAAKRPATTPDHGIVSPASTSPPTKVAFAGAGKIRREPCAKCGLPVFIAERLNVGKLLYHRTCFRCARCNSQLTLANYYETENNEFCCETCPDEEKSHARVDDLDTTATSVLSRSLSDEEKSASLKKDQVPTTEDDYSAKFESALEDDSLKENSSDSKYKVARSFFMNSQVVGDSGDGEEKPPDLPKSKPPTINDSECIIISDEDSIGNNGGFPNRQFDTNVNILSSCSVSSSSSASGQLEKSHDVVTKDTISAEGDTSSLVKARMRLFETKSDASNEIPSPINNKKVPLKHSNSAEKSVQQPGFKDNVVDEIHDESIGGSRQKLSQKNDDSVITISGTSEDKTWAETPSFEDVVQQSEPEDNLVDKPEIEPIIDDEVITIQDDSIQEKGALTEHSKDEINESISEEFLKSVESEEVISEIPNKEVFETSLITAENEKILDVSSKPVETEEVLHQNQLNSKEMEIEKGDVKIAVAASPKIQEDEPIPTVTEEYPDDLNPFGDDDAPEQKSTIPKVGLNPFEDDDDDDDVVEKTPSPKPAARKKISPSTRVTMPLYIERVSVNPFEKSDDSMESKPIEPPMPAKRRIIKAPKISLNPFNSDDDDDDNDEIHSENKPVPKPRASRTSTGDPEQKSSDMGLSINSSSTFGSSTSLASSQSGLGAKKKKPAPKPPSLWMGTESGPSSLTSSPSQSVTHSPRATPKLRKTKKAPQPPTSIGIPVSSQTQMGGMVDEFEREKFAKDEVNRNRQSQISNFQSPTSSENSLSASVPNKSTYGKWKRRKAQAPSRPIPQRRAIKALPLAEVKQELEVIEIQQQGLEKQGVRLEQIIREKCEGPNVNPDDSLSPEVEDLVLQLFELVNEKNELFRRQAELMYLRRQQRLEEEHADVEYQVRCRMLQPEANKTDSDKAREEELINRLVEIVERRNEIIECLEMDRVREAEEDDSINNQLSLYTLKKEEEKSSDHKVDKKDKKKSKKEKKLKIKGKKVDVDKDIDESETSTSIENVVKEKKKKKFNIF